MSIVFALGAAMAFGSADFAGGLAARRTAPLLAALGSQVSGLLVLVVALPLLGPTSASTRDLAIGAVAGLFGGSGLVVLFRALAQGPMSIVAPTTALSASLVPIAAGLALGDRPGATTALGIVVSLLAVVLITHERHPDGQRVRFDRPVLAMALGGGALFGLFFVFLHQTSDGAGLWPLAAARMASIPLLAALTLRRGSGAPFTQLRFTPILLVSGVLDMGANVLYLLALRHGMLAVVAAVTGLYPASTVVLAQTQLQERLHPSQLAGLGVAAVAAVLIAV